MAEQKLHVTLIAHTPEPEKVIAMASRTCYSPLDLAGLKDKAETADNAAYIRRVLASGHTSVIEHASFTFGIEGVSRTLLAWRAFRCRASAMCPTRGRRFSTL